VCYGKVRGGDGAFVVGEVDCGWRGCLRGGVDVFEAVRLSCGRLGGCGRGEGG